MKRLVITIIFLNAFISSGLNAKALIVALSGGDYTTINEACAAMQPGDTVLVKAGKYTAGAYMNNKGEEGKMLTIKNFPGDMPEINGWKEDNTTNGGAAFSNAEDNPAGYMRIEGFYVTGFKFGAMSINWKQVSDSEKTSLILGNNIEARYNVVDLCGQNGLSIFFTGNVTVENNMVSRTGWQLDSWSSGINILSDGGAIVVRNNVSFHHIDISSDRSDGNGFIIDQSYAKITSAVFENNLAFLNGGSGFGTMATENVAYYNNTAYNNFQDANFNNGNRKAGGISFSNTESRNTKAVQNNLLVQTNRGDEGILVYGATESSLKNVQNNIFIKNALEASNIFMDAAGCDFRVKKDASVLGKGAADGIAANDIGFDPKAIKKEKNDRQPFYEFAPDIEYIKSKGGLTGCFAPTAHKNPPCAGAYEYKDPTGVEVKEKSRTEGLKPTVRCSETGRVLMFTFSREGTAGVSLVNLNGRTVCACGNLHHTAGKQSLALPLPGNLSRGIYLVKVSTPDETTVMAPVAVW